MNKTISFSFLLLIYLILFSPLFSWPVENGVAVCTSNYSQISVQMIPDGKGGAILVWRDGRLDYDYNYEVYAQRINSNGELLWTENGLAVSTAVTEDLQRNPVLTADGEEGAIITWEDKRYGYMDIFAQRVNSTGSTLWISNGVAVCTAWIDQDKPQIVSDGNNGAIIVWQDNRNYPHYAIYTQRINSIGSTLWTINGISINTVIGYQIEPKIVPDGTGGGIIIWKDYRFGRYNLYAQRIDNNGTLLWDLGGVVISTTIYHAKYHTPVIVSDVNGGAIITWSDSRDSVKLNIYTQWINSNGSTLWDFNGIAICTTTGSRAFPNILYGGNNEVIIIWEESRNGLNEQDIYIQKLNKSGDILWDSNGVAVCTADNSQYDYYMILDESGEVIVTWTDYRNGLPDIYAQKISNNGVPLWQDNGITVCTATNYQKYPQIVSDNAGGAIIAWRDSRNGNYDIFAQRINSDGLITEPLTVPKTLWEYFE